MKGTILILITTVSMSSFGQTLSIGRAIDVFWNPLDTNKIEDFEYHPKNYSDSITLTLDDIKYLDTANFRLYFTDSGYVKYSSFRASIEPKPIVFAIDGTPVLGCWMVIPVSSYSCNWITCVTHKSDKSIEIQLGYPKTVFKYYDQDLDDPRKAPTFIEYFLRTNKIKPRFQGE